MRDILFKGKNKRSSKWYEGNLIIKEKETNLETLDGEKISEKKYSIQYKNKNGKYSICEVYGRTVRQYTGHFDKNGNRIFEKDIVYVASEDETATIIWDIETARFMIKFSNWCADFDNYYGKELEIIEFNPELFEEEK